MKLTFASTISTSAIFFTLGLGAMCAGDNTVILSIEQGRTGFGICLIAAMVCALASLFTEPNP